MAWLSRTRKPEGDQSTGEGATVPAGPAQVGAGAAHDAAPQAGDPGRSTPTGRFGPLVALTSFDEAPVELSWQTPVNGELYRLVPGPDRPDYSIMVLERPVHFYPAERFDVGRVPAERRVPDRKGRPMVRVDALVVCSRFVGQQLHPGMKDLPVNVAYVIDESALTDQALDFGKIEYAAIGSLTEGRVERELEPEAAEQVTGPDEDHEDRTLTEAARVLREGVEDQRGAPVEHLTATLTLDGACQVVGLTGVADGTPPVPTPETFERLNAVLAALRTPADPRLEALEVRVTGDEVTYEVRHRS
jgi:hypothetical protein